MARYDPKYLEPLARFYRLVWDPNATPEAIAAARADEARHNPAEPGAEIPTYLFLRGGEVLGHLTTIPVQVLAAGRARPGFWLIGFMVHPEHRNGPIGFLLMKEAVAELPLVLSLTVQTGPQRIFQHMKFAHLGVVPNRIRPLRSARMLARLDLDALGAGATGARRRILGLSRAPGVAAAAGTALDLALRASSALRSPRGRHEIAEEVPSRDEIDALWTSAREALAPAAQRDAAYLVRRYEVGAGSPYRWITARERGRLRGLLTLRAPRAEGDARLAGIRVATIADLVYDPREPAVAAALLRGAERSALALSADALLCSSGRPDLLDLLARRGYLAAPGNLHFFLRDASGELPGASQLSDWWLSRGDMNSDGTF
ncbi:MAG TPA: GNAT family N-acetyltransferase [Myxococcota bacterium]|nr:GNAT family N-acetyltransferase [Myxococcota bacterium]